MTEKEAQKVLDELNEVRPEKLNNEAKRLFEAIMKIADNRDELQKTVERKNLEISSLERVHEYDVQMIDDVKGKAVELYNRIEEKDKIIDLMAEWLLNDDTSFGYMGLKEINTKEKLMQYFKNKVKEV